MQSRLQLHVHPHVYQHSYTGGNKGENVILHTQFLSSNIIVEASQRHEENESQKIS